MKKLETAYYENVSALYNAQKNFTRFEDLATSTSLTALECGSTHIKVSAKKYYRIGKIEATEIVHTDTMLPVELFNGDHVKNWQLILTKLIGNTDKVTMFDVIVDHYTREA